MSAGRYAPSPTGDLHIGNIRTAMLAWTWARQHGADFHLRIEDLEPIRYADDGQGYDQRQLADLAHLGLSYEGNIVYQSHRSSVYQDVLSELISRDLVFECYCSRKDIRQATQAPHGLDGSQLYPGTCYNLSESDRAQARARLKAQGRGPALRLRPQCDTYTIYDALYGEVTDTIDCCVLRRGDGTPAYNLAVVIDDDYQNVTQVVRGDDLLHSAPAQSYIAKELGLREPSYFHVPLVLNAQGRRLAKRDGAVTLRQLDDHNIGLIDIMYLIMTSTGCAEDTSCHDFSSPQEIMKYMVEHFCLDNMPRSPWIYADELLK